jgi:branched-chain amino acid aminotransferase
MPDLAIYKLIISENRPVKLKSLPIPSRNLSLNSVSRLLPGGVYTTFRTFEGNKVLPLQHHLGRLEASAALLGHEIKLEESIIYAAIRAAVTDYLPGDARIRLTVPLEYDLGEIFISIEPLKSPSEEDYSKGVWVVTYPLHRENPEAKQTSFIKIAEQIRRKLPPGVHEGLLLDDLGRILEGLSSNFFYVRDNKLWTAPQGVLSGITRGLVLAAASAQDLPVVFRAAPITEVPMFDEAFITSSTRSVLPVHKIDDFIIGKGERGPLTQLLSNAYWNVIKGMLVDLK